MSVVKLINDDCLNVMKQLEDESIDLIVTDPPYLMNYKSKYRKNKNNYFCKPIANDLNAEKTIIDFLNYSYRVLKKDSAIYMFCNSNKIDFFKQEVEKAGFKIKNIIVWVKNNWTAGDLKASYGKQYEFIILANKGRKCFKGKRITDVWEFDRVAGNTQLHQNQKPVDLLELCIKKHSDVGDLILDPFMGSGSTGVACLNTNRNFIGIEIDENYFNIAKERIEEIRNGNKKFKSR